MKWYLKVLSNYNEFDGRASRTEYWMFFLFSTIAMFFCAILDIMLGTTINEDFIGWFFMAYFLGTLIPSIAAQVRRLHDTNKSGLWVLISFVPYVGFIVLLILLALEGDGENDYGPEQIE